MQFALVHGTRICQLAADVASCFPVAPDLQWIQVGDDATVQDTFVSNAVVKYAAPIVIVSLPPSFLARDLFAQLTVADFTAIKAAIAANDTLGLLWSSLQGQGDAPIAVSSARFLAGWAGLKQAIGTVRAQAIAIAIGIPAV